jgi:hypothetical protein
MGKSFKAKEEILSVVRIAFWDPMREYARILGGPEVTIDEFEQRERAGLLYRGVLRIAVFPTNYGKGDDGDIADDFDRFCAVCLRVGNLSVGVEEVSLVASPMSVPNHFGALLSTGRHRRCPVIVLGQRFAQFPRLATAQASTLIIFRQAEPADQIDLARRIGQTIPGSWEGAPLQPTEHVAGLLRKTEHIVWTPETGARIVRPRSHFRKE